MRIPDAARIRMQRHHRAAIYSKWSEIRYFVCKSAHDTFVRNVYGPRSAMPSSIGCSAGVLQRQPLPVF